jgi:hypothetical protein
MSMLAQANKAVVQRIHHIYATRATCMDATPVRLASDLSKFYCRSKIYPVFNMVLK